MMLVAYSESGLQDATDGFRQDVQTNILEPLMSNAPKIIGNHVFSYRVAYADTDANASAWLLVFYERVRFLCLTLAKENMVRP